MVTKAEDRYFEDRYREVLSEAIKLKAQLAAERRGAGGDTVRMLQKNVDRLELEVLDLTQQVKQLGDIYSSTREELINLRRKHGKSTDLCMCGGVMESVGGVIEGELLGGQVWERTRVTGMARCAKCGKTRLDWESRSGMGQEYGDAPASVQELIPIPSRGYEALADGSEGEQAIVEGIAAMLKGNDNE